MKKALLIILTVIASAAGWFSLLLGIVGLEDHEMIGLAIFFILLGVFLIVLPVRVWAKYRKTHPRPTKHKDTFNNSNYFAPAENPVDTGEVAPAVAQTQAITCSTSTEPLFNGDYDELLPDTMDIALELGEISVSTLQRKLKLGYSRAARIVDQMEQLGLIGPYDGSKPRPVLVSRRQWEDMKQNLHTEGTTQTPPYVPDEMEEIKKLEDRFQIFYTYAQRRMLGAHEGKLLLKQLKDDFYTEEHPLSVQIRFEQLCEEYAPKFETPNPWLKIDSMKGQEFEMLCADILRKSGFQNIEMTPGSGDQGVDILAQKSGIKYAIQCKRYSGNLGNTPIQEVNAGKMFYHCHVGVIMTNQHFTKGAQELAEATGTLLWDRDTLQSMIDSISHDTESRT